MADADRYSILLVPEDGDGMPARQFVVDVRSLRRWVLLSGLAVGGLLSLGLYGVTTLPLNQAHHDLAQENIFLREQLHDIETRLDAADATLERVKLYDAQLREMVRDMESLEDIRGFITYAEEEAKESGTVQIRTDGVEEEEKKASGSEVEQL